LLLTLIKQLDDLPAAEAQIKVFTVVNGDATTLQSTLQMLFQSQMAGGGQMMQMMQMQNQGGGTSTVPLRFAVDTRTNSIIASGSAGDLGVVEAILTRLDDEVRNRKNFVFRLKNSPALTVANTITSFLTSERTLQQQAGPGMTSAFEQIEREVVVVPEQTTNSLVLSATPRFFDEIKSIIEQLDARPPMVMIQVLIAEVDLGCTNEFGIELGLQDSVLFDRSLLGNLVTTNTSVVTQTSTTNTTNVLGATNDPGFNFNNSLPLGNSGSDKAFANATNVAGQGLSSFALNRSNSQLGFGGLVLSLASENVSVLLRALAENHRVEVLQRPQIMTLDNQMAYIQVGQRVPTITNVTLNATGTTNTVTPQNVGLILQVQPRITPDGLVVMVIDAEKSLLEPEATGIPITSINNQIIRSPIIDTTIAQTTVSALSGHTVVLGGLIDNSKQESHRKVPMLGDLPLLGHLFRFDSTTNTKKELLIIMTPHIVKNEADADAVRRAEAARMSWCLSDVTRIYGEAGLRKRTDGWSDAETKVIYPDMKRQPGSLPGQDAIPEPIPAVPQSGQPTAAPPSADPPVLAPARGPVPIAPSPETIRPIGPRTSDPLPGDPNADARRRGVQQQAQYPSSPVRAAGNVQPVVYQQPAPGQQ
jgi:general secretion pathway protein D